MNAFTLPHARGPQILTLLTKHGPLSHRGLSQIIEPKINRVRLNEVLQRLIKKQFIVKRYDRVFRGAGVFYQINQNKLFWPQISKKINCSPNFLSQIQFRPIEHHHSEACAIWATIFESMFENICVLRDFEIPSSPLAMRLLIQLENERDMLPDLLLLISNPSCDQIATVAVEIERYMKTDARTILKLKKFANESLLDGVIYFCDNDGISSRLSRLYNSNVRASANRINNYGEHFMLFKSSLDTGKINSITLQNAMNEDVLLTSWMSILASKKPHERHDVDFKVQ